MVEYIHVLSGVLPRRFNDKNLIFSPNMTTKDGHQSGYQRPAKDDRKYVDSSRMMAVERG